jgi:hypothetical protein
MTALHAVVLLTSADQIPPHALERQLPVLHVEVDIVALEPREFGRNHVVFGCFVDIDRWNPTACSWRKPVEAALNGEEIADRIPSRERHGIDASTGLAGSW